MGFVTKDAVDSASWVEVLEKDGHTKHEYLKLSGCILWTERIEETKCILEKNFGQSMECVFPKGYIRDDGFFVAEEMIFSALCVLGTATPCFESAMIGKHFTLENGEFAKKYNDYKEFLNKGNKEVIAGLKDKIISILKDFTFQNQYGDTDEKYILITVRDNEIDVIDRSNSYCACTYSYSMDESENINIDFESRVEKSIGVVEEAESQFRLNDEINKLISASTKLALETYESKVVNELNEKTNNLSSQLNELSEKYKNAKVKLDEYTEKEAKAEAEAHKLAVDNKIKEYAAKMGNYSEFLIYRTKLDYSKTVDQIEVDLLLLLGKYNKDGPAVKYSYSPVSIPVDKVVNQYESRYGDLFDKIKK